MPGGPIPAGGRPTCGRPGPRCQTLKTRRFGSKWCSIGCPRHWMDSKARNGTPAPYSLAEFADQLSQLDPVHTLTDEEGRRLHQDLDDWKPARSLALELARMPNGRYAVSSRYIYLNEPTDHAEKLHRSFACFNSTQSTEFSGTTSTEDSSAAVRSSTRGDRLATNLT